MPEVSSRVIEPFVLETIEANMFDPKKLAKSLEYSSSHAKEAQAILEKRLKKMDNDTECMKTEKQKFLDRYAKGEIDRAAYVEESRWHDNEIIRIKIERDDLMKQVPTLHKQNLVADSIREFCQSVKSEFERCIEPESQRKFLLDYIERIVYSRDGIMIRGSVPIKIEAYKDPDQPSDASKIPFCIQREITKEWRAKNLHDQRHHSNNNQAY